MMRILAARFSVRLSGMVIQLSAQRGLYFEGQRLVAIELIDVQMLTRVEGAGFRPLVTRPRFVTSGGCGEC